MQFFTRLKPFVIPASLFCSGVAATLGALVGWVAADNHYKRKCKQEAVREDEFKGSILIKMLMKGNTNIKVAMYTYPKAARQDLQLILKNAGIKDAHSIIAGVEAEKIFNLVRNDLITPPKRGYSTYSMVDFDYVEGDFCFMGELRNVGICIVEGEEILVLSSRGITEKNSSLVKRIPMPNINETASAIVIDNSAYHILTFSPFNISPILNI